MLLLETCIIVVTIFLSLYAHVVADFSLPYPWPDESGFLWQAIAVAERNSLFAPELNPDRDIMWMPPGYVVLTGAAIKLFGFSLAKVRWMSWLYSVAAYLGLIYLLRNWQRRTAAYVILSLFFLNAFFVVMGNVARMEALLLLLLVAAAILLQHDKPWHGLSLLAAGLLIHPNAAPVLLFACAWCVCKYRLRWPKISMPAGIVALVVTLLFALYALYVWSRWDSFVSDMTWQAQKKLSRDTLKIAFMWQYAGLQAGFAAVTAFALFRKRSILLPLLFGWAFLVIRITGYEMWYMVYAAAAAAILFCGIIEVFPELLEKLRLPMRIRACAEVALLAILVAGGVQVQLIDLRPGYPGSLKWCDMRAERIRTYITHDDIAAVSRSVRQCAGDVVDPLVRFAPAADGLFFHSSTNRSFTPYDNLFSTRKPNIHVMHEISNSTFSWDDNIRQARRAWGMTAENLVLDRAGHRWYVKRVE